MALERLYTIVKGHIIKSVRLRMKNRRRLISQEHLAYGTAATHHLITPPATVLAGPGGYSCRFRSSHGRHYAWRRFTAMDTEERPGILGDCVFIQVHCESNLNKTEVTVETLKLGPVRWKIVALGHVKEKRGAGSNF